MYEPSPLIRCLVWRRPRLLAILSVAVRVDAMWCLRRKAKVITILLCVRLSVLLTEQSKSPVRDVEAAEDENSEKDLLSRVEVSETAQLLRGMERTERLLRSGCRKFGKDFAASWCCGGAQWLWRASWWEYRDDRPHASLLPPA